MLKITRAANGEVVLTVSGRLEAQNLAEMERTLSSEAGGRIVILDLKDLTHVDQDAVRFLERCEIANIRLNNCPAYIREWITRERDQCWRSAWRDQAQSMTKGKDSGMTLQSKRKRTETLGDLSGTTIPSHAEDTFTSHTSRSDEIRLRAYEIYLEREDLQGSELDDWLRAERELLSASPPKRTDLESGERPQAIREGT